MLIFQPKLTIDDTACFVSPANRSLVGISHDNGQRHSAHFYEYRLAARFQLLLVELTIQFF
jgi:hypothetical protein